MNESSTSETPKLPNLDAEVINEIEKEATMLAKDFCKLNKQLESSLNHISAATVCCMQTYKDSIDKYCESIEESAKEERIYLIKAKELSKTMEAVYRLQNKISSIKTVITTLDSQI